MSSESESNYSDFDSIVIDCGSGSCKAGFGGEDSPKAVFRPFVGRRCSNSYLVNVHDGGQEYYIGDKAMEKDKIQELNLKCPMERGVITNWDDMERIWHHVFDDQLHVSPEDYAILLTEALLSPKANREKMVQVMFETFNVRAMQVALQPVLSVYSSGRGSAISVECGDGVTQVLPVYEGYPILGAACQSEVAGTDLTGYLVSLLAEIGFNFSTTSERELVRSIKEKVCCVAEDCNQANLCTEDSSAVEQTFELPDGQKISIGRQRFRCPEPLFRPSLLGLRSPGIHEAVYSCIMRCDIDTRSDLLCNVVLSGGSTMLPGIEDRMHKELTALITPTKRVKIVSQPYRNAAVWIGGSILASLSTFQTAWVTRHEYSEWGPEILDRKRWS